MFNADNTIAVPGFYDDVVPLTEAERAMIAKTDLSEAQYKAVHRRAGRLGRRGLQHPRAHRRPAHAGRQRPVERLVRPWPQDHRAGQGGRAS